MGDVETPRRPTREQKRAFHYALVSQHIDALWDTAQAGFNEHGRGALFIDTLPRYEDASNPIPQTLYKPLAELTSWANAEFIQLVKAYDPAHQFVAVLSSLKEEIAYRVTLSE